MTAVLPEHPPGDRDEKYFVFILRRLYSTDDIQIKETCHTRRWFGKHVQV